MVKKFDDLYVQPFRHNQTVGEMDGQTDRNGMSLRASVKLGTSDAT